MKKLAFIAILALSLLATSCTTGMYSPQTGTVAQSQPATTGTTTTSTGSGLGDLLGGVGGGSVGGIIDVISSTLGITTTDIVGTWVYEEPAVMFESDNLLAKAGGQVAAQQVKNKLNGYYSKVGITKGKMTMTFDRDGKFSQTVGGKTMSGTYTVNNGQVELTYAGGTKQFVGTTQFDGNNLVIVVDATKLLNFAQTISSATNNTQLNSISALLSGFQGMKAGLEFKKQR